MKICRNPFTELQLDAIGYKNCCGLWTSVQPVFNDAAPWDIWNCKEFQDLRARVLAGDYSLCSNLMPCAKLKAGHVEDGLEPWMKVVMERPPIKLLFEHDASCQLACPQCRPSIYKRHPEQKSFDEKMFSLASEFLPTAEYLILNTWGEVFVSPSCRKLLAKINKTDYEHLKVELYTNGLLLPRKWDELNTCHENIHKINMSVDAASKSTYEQIRKHGKWEDALSAMRFIGELKRQGEIQEIQFNFCVQGLNYHELPRFIEMAFELDADIIHAAALVRLPHHTDDWWEMNNIVYQLPNGAYHRNHEDYLRMMMHPILADPRVTKTNLDIHEIIDALGHGHEVALVPAIRD